MLQFLRIAARNLITHQTRTLLIGGAVVAVTVILVFLLSFTAGIQNTILRNSTALASGHVNVAGFYKLSQTSSAPLVSGYKPILDLVKKNVPEAALFYTRIKGFGKVISDSHSVSLPMWGIDLKNEKDVIGHLQLAKKSTYIENYKTKEGESEVEGNLQDIEKPGNMAFFATHAKKLKVRVGDTVTISVPTTRNIYNTKDVRIAAVLADMGMMSSFTTFMNEHDMRELYQTPDDTTGQIMIMLKNPNDMPAVEERLRKVLTQAGHALMDKEEQPYWMKFDRVSGESWVGQRIDVTTWKDETAYTKWVMSLLGALTFVFTAVLLTIVVLGMVNTLWMAIRERTSEIGTLRAIGLQRRQVLIMFMLEALLLSVGSIVVGIGVGTLIVSLISAAHISVESEAFQMFVMSNVLEFKIDTGNLILTFSLVCFFLVLGSLFPSYRASKMKPVSAINHVN
ncbi:FtsX-like permease family protein [bacterium]|jgi:ABC-type lipoprotein release transport system permease subunit|nr:FtsX-like permease family protein [bacterium]